ncbi:MAG: hypothetical protein JJW00_10040 [Sulfurimonas sp.]|nr:hypothetical protein [Sulfurimonas sp.]
MATYIRLTDFKSVIQIIKNQRIDTMVHLGARAFGEVVQSVAFVLHKGE